MNQAVRRLRALPIRSRLALLVTTAVAVAVALASAACWFITRAQLTSQFDTTLRHTQVHELYLRSLIRACTSDGTDSIGSLPGYTVQIVTADGSACRPSSDAELPVSGQDVAVARGEQRDALHTVTDGDGVKRRVHTYVPGPGPVTVGVERYAVSLAQPTTTVDKPLTNLAWVLLLVSGIGAVGAGAAGLWVARTGLRPVDRLTEAVEHVARTEDLTIRIPVEDDSDDEVARLTRSFNSMTSALASSRDLQQQLIADAGHELRTPLTSLRTNIELLTRSEETGRPLPEADRRALLASVKAQMTELAALIGDLQELSRPDTGQAGDRTQVIPFQDAVESALRRARLRGPELTITADVRPWYVRAEPSALERAVVNVLDNAVKFSPAGGTVDVRLDGGVLTVRDHGPGIPADELPHVFDRFWRSPGARALPGSGLGLSIVARTVQQAGGEVTLAPADGGGTLVTVRLPGAPTPPPEAPGDSA
ncbi:MULTISPECIES: sensor histidine kinase [unclassified Streptomyces]|uniref:sensor histidine kinase n=1 Tax=unclassified Streptomyces TaxID=2593676 RepID=UPI00093B7006|nr:HAMP domain-containing sensor histidine kinase [Streptomyces sp. TSRI0107]OKJ84147.1 histidine kinase [Streptomyces sp. TSRI0107]